MKDSLRIVLSMAGACAIGAAVLGGVHVGTERYRIAAGTRTEKQAVSELVGLRAGDELLEIRLLLDREGRRILYATEGRTLGFTWEGVPVPDPAPALPDDEALEPAGRIFVARRGDTPSGFVVEGEAKGYKTLIRFFVALDGAFELTGVRVVQHEEDPGLGAEIATGWFQAQYAGKQAEALEVTKLPMPDDWRAALALRGGTSREGWAARFGTLHARERTQPVYAVTGATISSRALTDGVRAAVARFRARWKLIGPLLGARAPS